MNPGVVVIGPQFCQGHPVELTTVRKMISGNFRVKDVNGHIMFKVKGKFLSLHHRRVMYDAAGNPIITLQKEFMSSRWKVFGGRSTDARELFSVKKSSLVQMVSQMTTKLRVFLASNTGEDVCDFKIDDSWFEGSGKIYAGNSNNIIAEMRRIHVVQSIVLGNNSFRVTVNPNVDYAFVVALVVLLEEVVTGLKSKCIRKMVTSIFNPVDLITF